MRKERMKRRDVKERGGHSSAPFAAAAHIHHQPFSLSSLTACRSVVQSQDGDVVVVRLVMMTGMMLCRE